MSLGSVFATGLFAGGASCAAVQGGLLAGVVANRRPDEAPVIPRNKSKAARRKAERVEAKRRPDWALDTVPVAGFLAGKLVSHTLLGALLGLAGSRLELGFKARAATQLIAGLIMLILAAHLFGVRAVRNVIPQPPDRITRLIRRNTKSQLAVAPALLGLSTVLLPCGITLSVEVLAVASGSPLSGALIMGTFVVGTAPLFAVVGYLFRRSATALKGTLSKFAAGAVVLAGIFSINAGMVLIGSPYSLSALWASTTGGGGGSGSAVAATVKGGTQQIVIDVHDTAYTPSLVSAKAGMPTQLTLRTNGTRGCTRGIVIPAANIERSLPETGDTVIDLGKLDSGKLEYTCSMGMYRGAIDVA